MSHVTECYHSKCRIHSMRSDTKYSTSSFLTSNWTAREVYNLRQFHMGLYFCLCTSLNVTPVTVLDSNATGLVIYDTDGYVSSVDNVFQNNSVHVGAPFSEAAGGSLCRVRTTVHLASRAMEKFPRLHAQRKFCVLFLL